MPSLHKSAIALSEYYDEEEFEEFPVFVER